MRTKTKKRPACEWGEAWEALRAHIQTCHPCGMLWVGIGKDRYEHCAEYKRLEAVAASKPCTCPN